MNRLERFISNFEIVAIRMISSFVPWLAPIAPAWISYENMVGVLKINWVVAAITALVIELMGVSSVFTALEMYAYQDSKRQSDPDAPLSLSIWSVAFYLITVITINIALDDSPLIQRFAIGLLSILSVVAAIILAIRSQHSRRLVKIADEKEERKQKRVENKTVTKTVKQVIIEKPKDVTAKTWRSMSDDERNALIKAKEEDTPY